MNRRYRFSLQRWIHRGSRPPRCKEKVVIAAYPDSKTARERVKEAYPDWETSMFWPVWP